MTGRAVPWLVGLALLAGCVTVPEFRALEREVVELKRGRAAGGAPDARLAELGSDVMEIRDELARLQGAIEETRHAANQALAAAQEAREGGPSSEAGPPSGSPPGGVAAGQELGSLSEEVRDYEEGFRLYRGGEYQAAIDRFRAFLQTHASSEYADNALFWLGECHFKLGDHEQAVLAFDDVVKRYPQGNKVPDALYRQGVALLEIGKRTGQMSTYQPAARQIFEQIVREHPDSERVPEARRQLEKLGQ